MLKYISRKNLAVDPKNIFTFLLVPKINNEMVNRVFLNKCTVSFMVSYVEAYQLQ